MNRGPTALSGLGNPKAATSRGIPINQSGWSEAVIFFKVAVDNRFCMVREIDVSYVDLNLTQPSTHPVMFRNVNADLIRTRAGRANHYEARIIRFPDDRYLLSPNHF